MPIFEVPARHGWGGYVPKGSLFSVIDVEGGQAGDLFVFSADDVHEHLSASHSRVENGEVYPRAGWTFFSNARRPIVEFVSDSSPGRHDCLAAACDSRRYELLGAELGHRSCEGNLQQAASGLGFEVRYAPQPINLFTHFRVGSDGRLETYDVTTKPGDRVTLRTLMDCYVIVSACPQDILEFQPGGPTSLAVDVEETA